MHIAVLNGPNLDLLGERETHIYGTTTLATLEESVRRRGEERGVSVEWIQSNHEGELVEAIHGFRSRVDGAVVNPAAYTHTSWALRDAFLATRVPFVEVHLSNVFDREPERRQSLLADLARGFIAGFGPRGYLLALDALIDILRDD
jgi:3-dehydroquinate dehydratase-2